MKATDFPPCFVALCTKAFDLVGGLSQFDGDWIVAAPTTRHIAQLRHDVITHLYPFPILSHIHGYPSLPSMLEWFDPVV
jgi:hypothetical protein